MKLEMIKETCTDYSPIWERWTTSKIIGYSFHFGDPGNIRHSFYVMSERLHCDPHAVASLRELCKVEYSSYHDVTSFDPNEALGKAVILFVRGGRVVAVMRDQDQEGEREKE